MNINPQQKPKSERLERLADPEYKEEYEMPAWYQERLQEFLQLLESRDQFKKEMPSLPPDLYAKALTAYRELDETVEYLEQALADEYENYQEQQRREQEVDELIGAEVMSEELYIWVKHKKPYIFDKFVEHCTEGMTGAELAEHQAIVARREAEELAEILANPKPPAFEYENLYIKHRLPDPWIAELLLDIARIAFTIDDFFEINHDALKRLEGMRREFRFHVSDALPVRRRNIEEAILDTRKPLESGRRFLLDYTEEAINNGKFKLKSSGKIGYLEDYLEYLENCLYYKYVILKNTQPERLEGFTRAATEDLTPAETVEFFKLAAESEEKHLKSLLRSLEKERITTELVEQRRAAPGYRKIIGPQLSERVKNSMQWSHEQAIKREEDSLPEKIRQDIPDIFRRSLKIYKAVTVDMFPPERYEDEQSREDEEISRTLESMSDNMNILYIVIKHQTPHLFEEFHRIRTQDLTPEELEEFQQKIAHLEATRLEEILSCDEK